MDSSVVVDRDGSCAEEAELSFSGRKQGYLIAPLRIRELKFSCDLFGMDIG